MPNQAPATKQPAVTPRATYRLQLNENFTLNQARALVPYLRDLGVSHIYASPLFKATSHSTHGYDGCDFSQLNPELGAESDLENLVWTLREQGMGLIVDVVPNHMGGGPENAWWWDVLERGPESRFAGYFDINWDAPDPRSRGKVLLPVLGERYHQVLAKHELKIARRNGGMVVSYGDHLFPLNPAAMGTLEGGPEAVSADPKALDTVLEKQNYLLAWWGRGDGDLNYRRFCNIATLPALRMEDQKVFDHVFTLARRWVERGWIDGLRVDHIDGLRDPREFLDRLRALAPQAWILVEKILLGQEALPASWPIAGTTGYDFLNQAGGLFVDRRNEAAFINLDRGHGGVAGNFAELVREKKRLMLRTLLAAEYRQLTHLLLGIAASRWESRDFTRDEVAGALAELIACFPVYRSYVRPNAPGAIDEADGRHLKEADREARAARPGLPPELFDFILGLLLLKEQGAKESDFVARFQQLTVAVMAKGMEDTAFYCYNPLVALNEVGGNPAAFGVTPAEFHEFCGRRQKDWPQAMLASSTHDTKRSEDVRARLYLLSEIPQEWKAAVDRWSAINQRHRRRGWVDARTEYFYYQTLAGAWPLPLERAAAYMKKAAHEAGVSEAQHGGAERDAALREFVAATLADPEFTADLERFVQPLIQPGRVNSLAMTLLKLSAPGVPDIYQGTEFWDFSLVDPDNRRPVDFAARRKGMEAARRMEAAQAWKEGESGLPKLWLIQKALALRARRPDLFDANAAYEALAARGAAAEHAVLFSRAGKMITVVPRLSMSLEGKWGDTVVDLPPGKWRNELTGGAGLEGGVPVASLLAVFPVALLVREGDA